jgi:beta-lactamase class A
VLSERSRAQLIDWLKHCETGLQRLRAGVPATWQTGTGTRGAANDVAIFWPPHRPPVLVAAYCNDSTAPTEALNSVHAELGRIVAATFA